MSTAPPPRTVRAAQLVLLLGLALFAPPARADRRVESVPRLSLPGGCEVSPGQVVDLRWSATDDVKELEILLSTDGGATYTTCISPELDPGALRFRWRVPVRAGAHLSLRIRFNRGGREIEGPPLRLAATGAGDLPVPLGLPSGTAERPAPGRSGAATRGATSATEAGETGAAAPPVASRIVHEPDAPLRNLAPSPSCLSARSPRFQPLRN